MSGTSSIFDIARHLILIIFLLQFQTMHKEHAPSSWLGASCSIILVNPKHMHIRRELVLIHVQKIIFYIHLSASREAV